ncbi:MAG: GGDEF domain-containing protein [Candidatus Omnitrophica bacterium]|nr:GGDEF domain-containing protein [Candidatus Omnitrophota bacterium]
MRRVTTCLLAYGLLLAALFHIVPPGGLFFLVSVFLAGSIAVGLIEYREGILSLRISLDSQIEKADSEKKRLTGEIKGSDDYISELKNKEAVIVSLYDVTRKMSRELTFNEIFKALSTFLRENFIFRKSSLIILREEGEALKVSKVYKVFKEPQDNEEDKEYNYDDIVKAFSKDKTEIYMQKDDGSTFAAIPLLSENKFVGILTIDNLSKADFDRFLIVAMQFALGIKKVLLYETVEELAITDSLTGLYTRRYFFERFDEELQRSKRHGFKFSFLMIDIDDFKRCNDTYGHLVGDAVLKETAHIAKGSTREIDLTARYGGEEFSIILPETDRAGAMLVAERIRKKIEENIFTAYDEKLKVTVSIGLAVYPDDSQEAPDLIEAADKALYAAKSSGKNIVCEYKE